MKRLRTPLEIKKAIINLLKKEKELSLRRLDIKLNTNSKTIRSHCEELEFLGIVKIKKHQKNTKNGKPYTNVELTDYGKNIKI